MIRITSKSLLPAVLLSASFAASSHNLSSLNNQIEQCYAETTQMNLTPDKSVCHKVIQHDLTTRDNKAIALHNLGVVQIKAGLPEQAKQSFQQAIALNKKQIPTLLPLAQLTKAQQPKLAKQYVAQVLALDEGNSAALALKSRWNESTGGALPKPKVVASE